MASWRDFPLPDGSYADDTRPFSQQDVVNYLPTFAEAQGTRSRAKYKTVPGLAHFTHVGDGPHRGARDVEGKAFIVSGRKLYQVAVDGTATEIGTIPGTGRVSMTHNQIAGGNQLIMATGDNSYVYDTVTETLVATGVALVCVDFLNQRILGVDQARRFWRYSGVATATSWEELDNESAESSPDRIVGGIVSQGEWLVFGERTIEVFSNSPNEATAFVRSQVIEKGCANANTICRLDNSVMWVGNDGVPYRLNGYTPVPIASKAIIDTISSGNPRKLSAFTWEDKGYVCYYVTAQDGYTFGYDVTSGKWHRRESYGFDRWRINTLFKWNNAWYAGDFQNGRMYRLEWGYVYEGCEIMPRKIRTGVMHNNGNRVTLHGFRLDVATGGPASEPNCPEYVPPAPPEERFLGTGRLAAGFRACTRPLSYDGVWQGAADADATGVNSTYVSGAYRLGDSIVVLPKEDGYSTMPLSSSALTDLATWTSGATIVSSSSGLTGNVSGSRLFTCGYGATIHYIESASDVSFTAGATASGGSVDSDIRDLAGNGEQLVAINAYGQLWGSSNNGTTLTVGADMFDGGAANRFYTSYPAIDVNATRFVIAGGETSCRACFTDNLGASATYSTLPAGSGIARQVKYCGDDKWLIACADMVTPVNDGLLLSTDNGVNFTAVDLPAQLHFNQAYRQSIAVDDISGRVVIFGSEHGTNTPRCFYTDDFVTWTEISRTGTAVTGIAELYPIGTAP